MSDSNSLGAFADWYDSSSSVRSFESQIVMLSEAIDTRTTKLVNAKVLIPGTENIYIRKFEVRVEPLIKIYFSNVTEYSRIIITFCIEWDGNTFEITQFIEVVKGQIVSTDDLLPGFKINETAVPRTNLFQVKDFEGDAIVVIGPIEDEA